LKRGWQRHFDESIPLPDGRTLVTLHDAATFITALPKKEAALPEWQAAIEALMLVAVECIGLGEDAPLGMISAALRCSPGLASCAH
jgi:hypothetical protein